MAKDQKELNKRLLLTDRLVQVNAEVLSMGTKDDGPYWELQVCNIGKYIIYLTEYTFDGTKHSNINRLLPPGNGQWTCIVPDIEKCSKGDIPQHFIEMILGDDE